MTIIDSFASFSTNDVAKAKEFYQNILGLTVTDQMGGIELAIPGGGHAFIYPKPDHSAANFTVMNFMVSDLTSAVDELSGKGVSFEKYNQGMLQTDEKGISTGQGPKMAWFKDPAGNFLALMQKS